MNLGSKIRNAREDLDITQTEMAALIPMNQSNYSKIERNSQEPNVFQLKRIAEILKLDLNELFEITKQQEDKSADLMFAKKIKEIYNEIYNKK